jgi:hypothetical protein
MQPTALEQLVATTLTDLRGEIPEAVARSVLLREGSFVGYRFRCAGFEAVWLAESKTVGFFDSEQKLLKTVACETVERLAAA